MRLRFNSVARIRTCEGEIGWWDRIRMGGRTNGERTDARTLLGRREV